MERVGDPDAPPSLVIVVDEFAALVQEVPEFVDGVVNVAQRGRSLGLHLILATQRPAGVIKDNLRANTNLRLALRVADEADSTDVLGSAEAASFDASIPGRAVSRTGPAQLVPFQSAYVGGWTSDTPASPAIEVETFGFGAPSRVGGRRRLGGTRARDATDRHPAHRGQHPIRPRQGSTARPASTLATGSGAGLRPCRVAQPPARRRARLRCGGRPRPPRTADCRLPPGSRREPRCLRHRQLWQEHASSRPWPLRQGSPSGVARATCTGWISGPVACRCSRNCLMSEASSPAPITRGSAACSQCCGSASTTGPPATRGSELGRSRITGDWPTMRTSLGSCFSWTVWGPSAPPTRGPSTVACSRCSSRLPPMDGR